ncbi:unnamed protein product, partial [marine sediment metagenome]
LKQNENKITSGHRYIHNLCRDLIEHMPASECPICMDTKQHTKLGLCGHTICGDCNETLRESRNTKCPICRVENFNEYEYE